ncbi:MAG: hypothetical protein Q9218_001509 [Villophora microphyllina]
MPQMRTLFALGLLVPGLFQGAVSDTFSRMTCWCRSEAKIGWYNHYDYYNTFLDKHFPMTEECVNIVAKEECLKWHVRETMICQDYPGKLPLTVGPSVNTFCYHHRGHELFTKGNEDDVLRFNRHKRNIPKNLIVAHTTKDAVAEACGTICDQRFRLPMMEPYDPGHGVIESHAEFWNGFWNLNDTCDGCGGYRAEGHQPGKGVFNDKGGPDHDLTGHYGPEGWYDTTGYDAHGLLDRLPHIG